MKLHTIADPETRRISASLMASQMRGGWLVQDLAALAASPLGRVPSEDIEGGRHENLTDPEHCPDLPGFFLQKNRTSVFPRCRTVALRLDHSRPVVDQLRAAVAKIEARA